MPTDSLVEIRRDSNVMALGIADAAEDVYETSPDAFHAATTLASVGPVRLRFARFASYVETAVA
jgi:hypothetical protein